MNSADLCRQNGWTVGTILEGHEGRWPEQVQITAIGEQSVLVKSLEGCWSVEHLWYVGYRDWKKVMPKPKIEKELSE
jgi:hypothetical protein